MPFDLSYELDIWGKVRRAFEAAGDQAQASAADYENVQLTMKADVATTYFAIRTADSQIDVQRRTIDSYKENLKLTNSRFQGGVSTQLDVDQAEATLASAQAQLSTLNQSRAQLEHALAVLLGETPESLSLAFHPLNLEPRPSRPACRRICSSAGPTWPRRSGRPPPRTPRSAWPSPPTSRSCT